MVRGATDNDIRSVVSIHLSAFRGFFLSRLGPSFLGEYYSVVRAYEKSIFLVAEQEGRVVGFAAGFVEPSAFYWKLRRDALRLGISMVPALVRRPGLLRGILVDFRKTGENANNESSRSAAELASVAVDPSYSGRGEGANLIEAFVSHARLLGGEYVYLTTDAHENEAVNRFYVRSGFRLHRSFVVPPGRVMNEYRRPLRSGTS